MRQQSRQRQAHAKNTHITQEMEMTHQYRQGDVLVSRVRTMPVGATLVTDPRVILAHGEVTGHCHEVVPVMDERCEMPAAQLFDAPDGTRYLLVDRPCQLIHQEHHTISLAPGAYKVTRQREYSPEAVRPVAD
jgi:hypothetical protein